MTEKAAVIPPIVCVIDASVAIKWFSKVDEGGMEQAIRLQKLHFEKNCLLVAPSLLIYEVVNALRYNPYFKQSDTELAFQSLYKMELSLIDLKEKEIKRMIKLAYQRNITIYDASYLSLAQEHQAFLITADMKFYQKIKDFPQVIALHNFSM